MCDEVEQRLVDAGIVGPRPAHQPGQLNAVVGGKILLDQEHLLLDQVVVVQEPLARGRRSTGLACCRGELAVVGDELRRGPGGHVDQGSRPELPAHRPRLRGGDDAGVIGETFCREKLRAHRLVGRDVSPSHRCRSIRHRTPRGRDHAGALGHRFAP